MVQSVLQQSVEPSREAGKDRLERPDRGRHRRYVPATTLTYISNTKDTNLIENVLAGASGVGALLVRTLDKMGAQVIVLDINECEDAPGAQRPPTISHRSISDADSFQCFRFCLVLHLRRVELRRGDGCRKADQGNGEPFLCKRSTTVS